MSLSISENDIQTTTHSIFDDAKIGNRFLTYNGLTAVYLYSKSDRHIFYVEGIKNMLAYDLKGYPMYNENTELRITKKIRLIWHFIQHIAMNNAKNVKRTNVVGVFGKTKQHHITTRIHLLQHKPMCIMKVVTYRKVHKT